MTINLRADERSRALIDRAARALGKSRSEFMLDSARREATSVLLDRRLFVVDDAAYQDFVDTLDQPARDIGLLRALLSRTPPWKP